MRYRPQAHLCKPTTHLSFVTRGDVNLPDRLDVMVHV